MIQRKQTIFLILAFFSFIPLFIFPFASFQLGTTITCYISILGIQNLDGFTKFNGMFIIMQILATLFMSLIAVVIFLYKKRPLQIRLCAFAFLLNASLIAVMLFTVSKVTKAMFLDAIPANYLFPTYIPIVTVLLVMMAQRAIRKDEAMVKSQNRLR
jgi:hypothetical protein